MPKFQCDSCNKFFDDDDPEEIEFMRIAREKYGHDIKRGALLKLCIPCKNISVIEAKENNAKLENHWMISEN